MRAAPFVSESAQWQIISCTENAPGAGRHLSASRGTAASASRSRAGPVAYRSILRSRSSAPSVIAISSALWPAHPRRRRADHAGEVVRVRDPRLARFVDALNGLVRQLHMERRQVLFQLRYALGPDDG